MRIFIRKGLLLLLSVFFAFSTLYTVQANSLEAKRSQLEEIKKSLKSAKENLEKTKKEKNEVMQNIARLDQELENVEAYLDEINTKIKELEAEIEEKQKELEEAERQRAEKYEEFKERVKCMYMNRKVGYIQVLFNSKSFSDFLNRIDIFSRIAEHDQKLMDSMKENEEKIKTQQQELNDKKDEVTLIKKEQLGVKYTLEQTIKQREAALQELSKDEVLWMQMIKEEEEISKKLEQEIIELTKRSTRVYSGGALEWPVPGYYSLSSGYGERTDPIYGGAEFHKGIDIPAPRGVSVVAAADGEVISAGYINGYGYTVIIDHGSGITTLYGHNSQLLVSTGQIVSRGEAIAKVGSTGNSTGNHCHFEVRIKGAHVNPLQYFSR
ncbi:MAG: peptidoglycan DD-metalloendopeptidase family protein [Epulopiscium sp.]|jgi:murein DD-endopeptidase MepM/ murein hydrolase activator NlpD|nr:peptidoglycan DD-metalloendopeptidase family protein [Candidatus Epulonipiscium sp.]HOQ16324.1 peptidoglycan DD-metalloendopeptidase family protein [Defluviitaleaceae bacterium]HPT75467.1 peptidoglycan DD-metalloendopeptidase family protein [Defluviitaleaceae bacterium]